MPPSRAFFVVSSIVFFSLSLLKAFAQEPAIVDAGSAWSEPETVATIGEDLEAWRKIEKRRAAL
jgi:hypothetical protein